ncbi:GNAT family N-acetyltransferase [Streptomyces sp. NPDC002574]|uniref:GNAT family N-acetyltransferase n=1 Tax=Streptomyces sp. NPDC002574 TaxID=3364652 RepID=UPI0036D1D38A
MPTTEITTTSERPDLYQQAKDALRDVWPAFVLHDPFSKTYRRRATTCFPRFDVLLVRDGEVVANAAGVALRWDGDVDTLPAGYDGALEQAVTEHEASVAPDTLCIMVATVLPGHAGRGLAGAALTALRERAAEAGLRRVIAPVRPALKARYPLTSMEDFAGWTRDDGLHLDPWIRTHQRLGARVLAPAPRSMVVPGTVAQWEQWAAMAFPQTGRYVVPDALDPVEIDRERDQGLYAETNLWMRHQ